MTEVPSHRLKQAKRVLRREILAARDRLPDDRRAAMSASIADRLLAMDELRDAGTVMAFWSFGSEVDTSPLLERLEAAGTRVVLPRIEDRDIEPVAYAAGDPLSETSFGAKEPASGRRLEPSELDVVVVPGVAFDRSGGRVGYGAGFYDRLLGRVRDDAFAVAVAFGLQVVDRVPAGGTDRRVGAVVTEREVIRGVER
jgi:5-formyltetrahydrofolate cyclo-ligase